jgi:hypothetical protein
MPALTPAALLAALGITASWSGGKPDFKEADP